MGFADELLRPLVGVDVSAAVGRLLRQRAPVTPFFLRSASGLGCLTQWHRSEFELGGQRYGCAEQCMMHHKALLAGDGEMAQRILEAHSPDTQKRLGRQVRGLDQEEWRRERCGIVARANVAKFAQNPGLRKRLLRTSGTVLAEANPKDGIWGVGLAEGDPRIADPASWQGSNLLGLILMCVRENLETDRTG